MSRAAFVVGGAANGYRCIAVDLVKETIVTK